MSLFLAVFLGAGVIVFAMICWYTSGFWVRWERRNQDEQEIDQDFAKVWFASELLDPARERRFKTISPRAWAYVQKRARQILHEESQKIVALSGGAIDTLSPVLRNHLTSIIEGNVPFGLKVEGRI